MSTVPFIPKKDAERPDESTLTDRQRKVLGAIKKHLAEQGFAPSFREIGEAAGLKSPSSVKHQLQVLDEKGFIRMNANKGRAIEVVDTSSSSKATQGHSIPKPIRFQRLHHGLTRCSFGGAHRSGSAHHRRTACG